MDKSMRKCNSLYYCLISLILHLNILFSAAKFNNSVNSPFIKRIAPTDEFEILEQLLFPEPHFDCGSVVNITDKYGFVKSPNYPNVYNAPALCRWNIVGNRPDEVITISIVEMDIGIEIDVYEKCNVNFDASQCCKLNYLKLSSQNSERYFCGERNNKHQSWVFISSDNHVSVLFNVTNNRYRTRGFYFAFVISPRYSEFCSPNEFRCASGRCIVKQWRCNGQQECGDGSDEVSCHLPQTTNNDRYMCGAGPDDYSFYESNKRCDYKFDCANRMDELGCGDCPPNQFKCATSLSCIDANLLCNGVPDCADYSDELNCGFCPPNQIRCGTLEACYDPSLQRCDKMLDCPNAIDEFNCFDGCRDSIACQLGAGCYGLKERCNGIVQCADYSDELNCTEELCRVDKNSFLCTGGRCIPSLWTCDRANDCFDGSDEMSCLKNSVITAAIIGSLICGLLLVVAISCACKLVAFRHMEQYRAALASTPATAPNGYPLTGGSARPGFPITEFPFPANTTGDLDASLFHSILFREPPPSYASIMGGYHDANGTNVSYMEQYRRYRRQRRCRRMMRRQMRQQAAITSTGEEAALDEGVVVEPPINDSLPTEEAILARLVPAISSNSISISETNHTVAFPLEESGSKKFIHSCSGPVKVQLLPEQTNSQQQQQQQQQSTLAGNSSIQSASRTSLAAPVTPTSSAVLRDNNLNIELEPITPLNFDCDSQPLIR